MCLYPKLILNRKYVSNKKNGGNPPQLHDERIKYVAVGCGHCIECRKKKAREWQVRLTEEIKNKNNFTFVTLTFNEESLEKLRKEIDTNEKDDNTTATLAVRRFLERWRKKYKKSVRHWLITEKGHENTKRIHLHGIIGSTDKKTIEDIWGYGYVYIGDYVNNKTINYIVKYVTKIDNDNIGFEGRILCSKGIGSGYMESDKAKLHKFRNENTRDNYILPNGQKINNPIYYRNKLYSDDEREKLWLQLLDKKERYVLGEKIDVSTIEGEKRYWRVLKEAQKKNKRLGYGDDEKCWKRDSYKKSLKKIKKSVGN